MLIALPFILVLGFPIAFVFYVYDHCDSYKNSKGCSYILLTLFFFLIGMALNIIIIPLAIISIPFVIIYGITWYCKKRLEMRKEYRRLIKLKFEGDQNLM